MAPISGTPVVEDRNASLGQGLGDGNLHRRSSDSDELETPQRLDTLVVVQQVDFLEDRWDSKE